MSIIINTTQHNKWAKEWQEIIKRLSSQLDQAKATQVETLLSEGQTQKDKQDKLEKEIRQLKSEQKTLGNIVKYSLEAKKEHDRLDNATHKATHNPREEAFLGVKTDGTPVTSTKYRTDGWLELARKQFDPGTSTLDNIYKVKVGAGEEDTTEEQIINTIARVVKSFEKIDATDFEAKFNALNSDTTKQGQVKVLLKYLQDQAKEIRVGSDKNGQRSYDFSHNYQKFDKSTNTWTFYTQGKFNYQNFWDFINLVHGQAFLNNLDPAKQAQVDKNENWQIFLKGEKYEEDFLKEYGIIIDPAKTTLCKTSETAKKTLPSGKGISGWLEIAHSITQQSNNLTKLNQAFSSSPTQQLLTDLQSWNQVDGYLTDGTNFTLPESLDSMVEVLAELEAKKISAATEQTMIAKQIKDKTDELATEKDTWTTKETQLDNLIKEIVAKHRELLKPYELNKGIKDANKREVSELHQIKELILNIKYLENNGDTTLASSISEENTTYDQIKEILEKVEEECGLVESFKDYAFVKQGEFDFNKAITGIKAGKIKNKDQERIILWKLEDFQKDFENKDKLVKLSEWETQAWTAIKKALGQQDDPQEDLTAYQTALKALDPILTETIINQAIIDDWKTQNNFNKIATMKAELGKVLENSALKASFKTAMNKADSEITDLAKLLQKKKAKEIITMIRRWEYDNSTDSDKRKKLVWTLELKDDKGKYLDDKDLSDKEINEVLYEIAVGKKSLADQKKSDETKDEPQTSQPFHRLDNVLMYAAYGVPTSAIILGTVFWDKIKGFWADKETEIDSEDDRE